MPAPPSLLVTRRLPAAVEARLHAGFRCTTSPDDAPLDAGALARALATHDAVCCTVTDRLTADVFAAAGAHPAGVRTRLLANVGVGVNHVALDAARAHGVRVTNTPDVLTDDTADLAVALVLMTMRRLGEGERLVRAGAWRGWAPTHHLGRTLRTATLGVVGWGRIGRATAERAHRAFGMRRRLPHATSRAPRRAVGRAVRHARRAARGERRRLAALPGDARHAPPDERAHPRADEAGRGARQHGARRRGRRGRARRRAGDGRLAGAGLDVHAHEPRVHPGLLAREDVVLLPHLGSATLETRTAMGLRAADNLEAWRDGRPLPDAVA
jgi:lactate dehydrogenase-like 2-hydroxyacid dehydrogenase